MYALMLIGLLITLFSAKIVFPGLELVLGIETIVGNENVVYEQDGSYIFTNPGAMVRWISGVALIGILISSTSAYLLWRPWKSKPSAPVRP